jgi:hypothetical protein
LVLFSFGKLSVFFSIHNYQPNFTKEVTIKLPVKHRGIAGFPRKKNLHFLCDEEKIATIPIHLSLSPYLRRLVMKLPKRIAVLGKSSQSLHTILDSVGFRCAKRGLGAGVSHYQALTTEIACIANLEATFAQLRYLENWKPSSLLITISDRVLDAQRDAIDNLVKWAVENRKSQ